MSTQPARSIQPQTANGVDVEKLHGVIAAIEADHDFGRFQFRARNQWISGGQSRSEVRDFYAGGQQDNTRAAPFHIDADMPQLVAGHDRAPNSMEYLLHTLISCLTTTMVYHAAVRDIKISQVHSQVEGDMDVRGLFGMAEEVPKGFQQVRVTLTIDSEADIATLRECALFSPVYEIVSTALPVELVLQKS